jgi:hypothetical protein
MGLPAGAFTSTYISYDPIYQNTSMESVLNQFYYPTQSVQVTHDIASDGFYVQMVPNKDYWPNGIAPAPFTAYINRSLVDGRHVHSIINEINRQRDSLTIMDCCDILREALKKV